MIRFRCWRETDGGARLESGVFVNAPSIEEARGCAAVMFGVPMVNVRAEQEPATIAEHEAAYRGAHSKAVDLQLMIDGGMVDSTMDPEKHARLAGEYAEALAEMSYHYNEARRRRLQQGESQ